MMPRSLLFGPLTAISFRLDGRDSLPNAAEQVRTDAQSLGAVQSPDFTEEQSAELRALAGKLCEALAAPSVAEIFGLLSGQPADERSE